MVIAVLCGNSGADDSAAVKRIREELNKPTTLEVSETPLIDVVRFLKKLHDINIEFDRVSLENAGINPDDTLITRGLKHVSLKSALNLVLHPLGLTYLIENEVLLITSPDTGRSSAVPEVFDVGALVLKPDEREELCRAVQMLLAQTEADVCIVRGKLIVRASEPERQRIANLLGRIKGDPDDKKADPAKSATKP